MKSGLQFTLLFLFIFTLTTASGQYSHDSIKTEHGYLHYYTKGKGEPIVLLQGNTGSSSYYMRGISDSLNGYQIILVDYEGTGRSNYRKADSTWAKMDNIVRDYDLVRKHLKIDKWTLLGHSYGGQHALYYAVKYPKATKRIITIGAVTSDNQMMKYWFDNLAVFTSDEDRKLITETTNDPGLSPIQKARKLMGLRARSAFFDKSKVNSFPDFFPDDELMMITNLEYQRAWMSRSDFFTLDFSKELYALNLPIRMIQGRQDPVGERVPTILNMNAKDSKLTFIEKCGHFPWLEQPEVFYPVLTSFFRD